MPVENSRGPTIWPVRTISDIVNTVSVSLDGSCDVVTPNARLAISGQLACGIRPSPGPPRWACASTMPGMIVLPVGVDPLGACRNRTRDPSGPTATMRLPRTTMAPCSITSWRVGTGHGDDAGADERDLAGRYVARLGESDGNAGGLRRRWHLLSAFDERVRPGQIASEQLGAERPVDTAAVTGPMQRESRVARDLGHRVGRDRLAQSSPDGPSRETA